MGTTGGDNPHEDPPTVSVIIPVYNDAQRLRTCLAALAAQDYPADCFEVLVVDNASTVDLAPALPDGDDRFTLLHERKRGSYAARNTGVAAATGEVLAFTDGDCVPRPNWLSTGVAALRGEPPRDAVGGAINLVFRDGPAPATAPEFYEQFHGFEQQKYVERFSFAATANLIVGKSTFERVGYFNADLKSGGDLNWGTRLGAIGGTLAYGADVVVDHPSRPTWKEMSRKAVRVANGLADLAADSGTRTVLGRAAREVRGGVAVWRKVWEMPELPGVPAKVRYASAYSYVSVLRASVRLARVARRPHGGARHPASGAVQMVRAS